METLTFGCRLNAVESDAIREAAQASCRQDDQACGEQGDLVVVNTCAVTAEAGRQARKAIRRIARERPGARIAVTGCGAEVERQAYRAMPEVARIVGNGVKLDPATWAPEAWGSGPPVGGSCAIPPSQAGQPGRTRAFVAVQNGCDHRCTFCVIPFGRGPSRSLPPDAAVAGVRALVGRGAREAVLTGVDLTAYGRDLDPGLTLGRLVRRILAEVPDLARLRLSSIDSVEADDALLAAFADEPRLMPHVHLSLQAGDDLVLKRMKRRHGRADAIRFCADLRAARPGMVFGADLIAGFPTESETAFARSLALVEECGLTHLHVFPYSPRPGTPAERMLQVPGAVVRARAARLRAAGEAALRRHLDAEVGQVRRVLAERGGLARTEAFTPLRLPEALRESTAPGTILDVRVAGHDGRMLLGAAG